MQVVTSLDKRFDAKACDLWTRVGVALDAPLQPYSRGCV